MEPVVRLMLNFSRLSFFEFGKIPFFYNFHEISFLFGMPFKLMNK